MSTLSTSFALLSALFVALPAAAQQRAPATTPAPPANPNRLVEPSAAETARRETTASRMPIAEQDNMALAVGLFSVSGHFVRDRGARGREPLIDTGGRENRVAAVGLSLRF